ncbi:MAG: proteasome accessory factor PafA2 family protein, partial [Armatimonadota bacterium]
DIELGNLILGDDVHVVGPSEASRALLREIDGLPVRRTYVYNYSSDRQWRCAEGYYPVAGSSWATYNPQDWGRKFLASNGGCVYIDLDHLEICLPEVLSARDWVGWFHAMLRIARRAMGKANSRRNDGRRIQVLVNNSDGFGHSYGSHLDFLITRRAWANVFHRKLHYMLWLASYQVSSVIFTGQGKVGSENDSPAVDFQLSQRADFFETLTEVQTTHSRPIVNSRDEALCGSGGGCSDSMARLHCIFYDSNLCHTANLLKIGVMQIILAMLERELVNVDLILDDPVEAVKTFSYDHTLRAEARLASGKCVTAVDLQMRFLEDAARFVESGGCEGIVPHADEIIGRWSDVLSKLKQRDLPALSEHLDWALKLRILQSTMDTYPDLAWDSPQIKMLDHLYSSLEPSEGLYWACESEN